MTYYNNKSAVARFARNKILVAQDRNLYRRESLAVFTKRPALPAIVPCFVAQQLNRHGNIVRFQKWTFVIQFQGKVAPICSWS